VKISDNPDVKHLVLLGGGHAQVAVLKSLAMRPIDGLRITLISRDVMTPYSGMLPGYLEGYYEADDIVIDLSHLARLAGARFIHAAVDAIDPARKEVSIKGRPALSYDVLSVNIGSNPDLDAIEGAGKHAVPVKPISTLLGRITPLLYDDASSDVMTIIGGGAAGVEVALSLDHFMKSRNRKVGVTLVHRGARIVPEFPERAARTLTRQLEKNGIRVITGTAVVSIARNTVTLSDGNTITSNQTLVVTAGRAPSFLAASGLDLDDRGFIAVSPTLQCLSHDDIFAAGDIATVMESPRPKAGVFAVRAGAILTTNVRAHLLGEALKSWTPQRHYLALIGTGGGRAVPTRGPYVLPASRWAWKLKVWIDKRFIRKFTALPEMKPSVSPFADKALKKTRQDKREDQPQADLDDPALLAMRCLGCGAKTGWSDLEAAMIAAEAYIRNTIGANLTSPRLDVAADSAELPLSGLPKGTLVQSVDAISALVDDPYQLGRIAALHAMSDVFASHARPHHALAMLTLPAALAEMQKDDITQLLAGAMLAFHENGAYLAGGHTSQARDLQVGFAVTGFADKRPLDNVKHGDALLLTKPLGVGMIMAGHMQGHPAATGRLREAAIEVMSRSNGPAAAILGKFGKFPMTDVTGFGLIRHTASLLSRIGDGSHSAVIITKAIPRLDGVLDLARAGIQSSLAGRNAVAAPVEGKSDLLPSILHDPQTGGGLLAVVPSSRVKHITADFEAKGESAVNIGTIKADGKARMEVKASW
jgi:selenide,water dikinase